MRLSRSLPLVIVGVVLGFGLLHFTLKNITQPQTPPGCAALSESGEFDPSQTVAFWQNQSLTPPTHLSSAPDQSTTSVLGTGTHDKWIEVDLTRQKIIAHQGGTIFLESPISSGLWNKTPVGSYRIWYKIKSTKMEGGVKGTKSYYYLPNVPYAMFFHLGYGIHGTYWHNNFGRPMSHGCVNSPTPIAEKLFYWTDPQLPPDKKWVRSSTDTPGTRVVIHY